MRLKHPTDFSVTFKFSGPAAPRSATQRRQVLTVVTGILLSLFSSPVMAQEPAQEPAEEATEKATDELTGEPVPTTKRKKKERVQIGVIANTGTTGQSGAVDVQTSGSSPGDEPSAITGSVAPISSSGCAASVLNNSKTSTYAVSFLVEGRNQRGLSSFKRNFSATVRPGETTTREFRCDPNHSFALTLKSATKR